MTKLALEGTVLEPAGSLSTLSIRPAEYMFYEGNAGSRGLFFEASLEPASGDPVTFHVHTADDSATVADGDYIAVNADFTIPAGQVSMTFPVTILGDTKVEPDESFEIAHPIGLGCCLQPSFECSLRPHPR